ncbi:MAG TPA: hypothetical protein VEK08_21510, partial [Planctomycetota bacterium]|nr:hypothetical protein [Planctomycetota bacterium]
GFLQMILSEVLPAVSELDELPLSDALKRFDKALGKLGLAPQGDRCWREQMETTARFYGGLPDTMAMIVAAEGIFVFYFLSEFEDGTWALTGLADDWERFIKKKGPDGLFVDNPKVRFESLDEPLPDIFKAHKAALKEAKRKTAPAARGIDAMVAAFERFQTAAFK